MRLLPKPSTRSRRTGAGLCAVALVATTPLLAADDPPARVEPAQLTPKPLSPADLDDELAIGGTEIDGKKVYTRMTVQVGVNGTGPYRFVVDSGADTSVVGRAIARRLSLPPGKQTTLNSITDSQIVDRVRVESLSVGPTTLTDLEVPVLRERDLGAEGMLGLDALVEQRLMLDFDKKLITVDDGRRPAPSLDGEIVVTARLRRGQLILTQVRAGPYPVDAVVDTGSEITIGNSALRDKLLRRRNAKFTEIEVVGVTGASAKLQYAQVPSLKIGSITLENVGIAFADVPPFHVFALKDKPSLLLGTDLMSVFRRVSLDFGRRKVRFQLRRCEGRETIMSVTSYSSRLVSTSPRSCA